jgi:hypothetical protein
MANHTAAETTEWVAANLRKAEHVTQVEVLSDQVLRVSRDKYAPYVAGIVSVKCVKVDDIMPLVESELGVEIIANVPKESYWTGEAIMLAQVHSIATGSYGDLLRVIDDEDVRAFQQKETAFIERGLRQHDRIVSFDRVHDRIYLIRRKGLPDVTVAMLNEYELTADHLRTARDRYGNFSLAVITNPNGRATSAANEAAQAMGVEILKWGAFFGRLNKK